MISMHHCHLVLDIHNMIEEEVEVQYAATQILLLPPQITKRSEFETFDCLIGSETKFFS